MVRRKKLKLMYIMEFKRVWARLATIKRSTGQNLFLMDGVVGSTKRVQEALKWRKCREWMPSNERIGEYLLRKRGQERSISSST